MSTIKKPSLPSLPGVYIFKNADGAIIYVGKAKCLKKRVASYFQKTDRDWKVKMLIDEHATIDHITTNTETEALLLEAQLIKQHQPKYNVLLKSGQPFVYLLFTQEKLPKLELVRNKKQMGTYFGPFMHKQHARGVYHYLMKTFKLEWCKQKIQEGCLRYHIGLCSGNCRDQFDPEEYLFRINLAMDLLKGHYNKSLKNLHAQIKEYSDNLEFEKARNVHEYLQNLDIIFNTLKARYTDTKYERDVFLATSPIHTRTEPDHSLAKKLQNFLQLDKPIITIDCFDISHFQSNAIVGSSVRFAHGVPDKQNFRRFKIRTLKEQNDYAALQEIVERRYKKLSDYPDLIVIDGGKGQLNAIAQQITHVPLVSLAKREERLFSKQFPDGIVLDKKSDIGTLFIALRDYAHHFAISYHRNRRSKEV